MLLKKNNNYNDKTINYTLYLNIYLNCINLISFINYIFE